MKDQIEKEKMVLALLAKLKIAVGSNPSDESLFKLDQFLENALNEMPLAPDVSVDRPKQVSN